MLRAINKHALMNTLFLCRYNLSPAIIAIGHFTKQFSREST